MVMIRTVLIARVVATTRAVGITMTRAETVDMADVDHNDHEG